VGWGGGEKGGGGGAESEGEGRKPNVWGKGMEVDGEDEESQKKLRQNDKRYKGE